MMAPQQQPPYYQDASAPVYYRQDAGLPAAPVVIEDPPPGCCEEAFTNATDCHRLPDACTNEVREERLIANQQLHSPLSSPHYDDGTSGSWLPRLIDRERHLIVACILLVLTMNWTPYGHYILYPFMILSTWVHEMCHGMAALLVGGNVVKLHIFRDGSGLAWTSVGGVNWKRGWVASAGYPGTAVTGCVLLLFRRTTLGPTIGTMGLGVCIVLSCALWVRNVWGVVVLLVEGLALIGLGWKLPAAVLDHAYSFLAATCCLNAVESIHDLFADGDYMVGGQVVTTSDAHTVADRWGMDSQFWAILWMCTSAVCTVIGIVCALDAKHVRWFKNNNSNNNNNNSHQGRFHPQAGVPAVAVPPDYTQAFVSVDNRTPNDYYAPYSDPDDDIRRIQQPSYQTSSSPPSSPPSDIALTLAHAEPMLPPQPPTTTKANTKAYGRMEPAIAYAEPMLEPQKPKKKQGLFGFLRRNNKSPKQQQPAIPAVVY